MQITTSAQQILDQYGVVFADLGDSALDLSIFDAVTEVNSCVRRLADAMRTTQRLMDTINESLKAGAPAMFSPTYTDLQAVALERNTAIEQLRVLARIRQSA